MATVSRPCSSQSIGEWRSRRSEADEAPRQRQGFCRRSGRENPFDFPRSRVHNSGVAGRLQTTVAALVIESGPRQGEVLALDRGVHLFGRSEACPFRFDDGAISSRHCEITVTEFGVKVRDLDSSNGTTVEGHPVQEAELKDGQRLALGDVVLRVVIPPVHIAIPALPEPEPVGPAVLSDGSAACYVHREQAAAFSCPHCGRTFCDACVHRLRLTGGKPRLLCPACSHLCAPLADGGASGPDDSVAARVLRTIRVAFDFRSSRRGGKRGAG